MDNLEAFEKFWQAYPKRKGDPAKGPAKELFLKAITKVEAETIISAAKKFAATQKVGTEYVMQAQKWLRHRRWEDFTVSATPVLPLGEPQPAAVFVRTDTPEWRAWQEYRKAQGLKPSPVKNFGWYFPTATPPNGTGG